MKWRLNKDSFPGQKKGLIRVLIKRGQQEESVQLEFNLFGEEDESII